VIALPVNGIGADGHVTATVDGAFAIVNDFEDESPVWFASPA
jgi:hypothetical protein